MTLNITMLTDQTIYQSADFRVIDCDTKQIISDSSNKLVTLQYGKWDGLLSYTGIGSWRGRETSAFVIEWLTGLTHATFEEVVLRIRDEGTKWLQSIETEWRRIRHTFILAGFVANTPYLAIISNFEDLLGRNDADAWSALEVSRWRFGGKPFAVVTGCKSAVRRYELRHLARLACGPSDNPARIRRRLAELNRSAAATPAFKGMISDACSVVSFRADGQGMGDVEGQVDVRPLIMGMPCPGLRALATRLGLGVVSSGATLQAAVGRLLGDAGSFASNLTISAVFNIIKKVSSQT
jgi:hypothetical protein